MTNKDIDAKEIDRLVPMNGFPINIRVTNDDPENPLYTEGKEEIFTFRRVIDIREILGVPGVSFQSVPSRYLIIERGPLSFCLNLDYQD